MADRRARGAVFTPVPVADRLAAVALAGRSAPHSVCDPAAGDGRLLRAVDNALGAGDARWFGGDLHEGAPAGPDTEWVTSDTLAQGLESWPDAPVAGFDLVIGNPPFRNQLQTSTSLGAHERQQVLARFGEVAGGYADTATMFLVAACEMAAPDGRVAFIMPLSFLTARDAAPARRRVLELATLDGIWIAPEQVFPDANVRVCALILDRSGPRRRAVRRWVGEDFVPLDPVEVDSDELATRHTWGRLAAGAFDVPEVELDQRHRFGELVTATAGFRDQFYGLAPLVVEHPDGPSPPHLAPLLTSGLIDPGSNMWGMRPARMAGTVWQRPAVDLRGLEQGSALERWVSERRQPKLLVATQTKVIEAAPDPGGVAIPSTPVIAVHAEGDDLWRALAVLLAPPISAWARACYSGAALSADAIKLSARQVLDLPLPVDATRWDRAAGLLAAAWDGHCIERRALVEAGHLMTGAYGCDPEVDRWWEARLPA